VCSASFRMRGGVSSPVNLHSIGEVYVDIGSRHQSLVISLVTLVAACRRIFVMYLFHLFQYGILNIYSWLIRKSNVNKLKIRRHTVVAPVGDVTS
jgi:hypothetical protein